MLPHPAPSLWKGIGSVTKALPAKLDVRGNVFRKFPPEFAGPLARYPMLPGHPGCAGALGGQEMRGNGEQDNVSAESPVGCSASTPGDPFTHAGQGATRQGEREVRFTQRPIGQVDLVRWIIEISIGRHSPSATVGTSFNPKPEVAAST